MPAATRVGPVGPQVFDCAVGIGAPFGREPHVKPLVVVAEHEPFLKAAVVLERREDAAPLQRLVHARPGGDCELPLRQELAASSRVGRHAVPAGKSQTHLGGQPVGAYSDVSLWLGLATRPRARSV